jgi:hypothetical protein
LVVRLLRVVGLVAVMVVPSWIQALPAPSQMATHVAPNEGDPLFVTWTMGWEAGALRHGTHDLLAGNIFYPRRDSIAWSDNLLLAAPLFGALNSLAGGRPILAYNLVTLLGFAAVGWAVYALALELLRDRPAALVAATLVGLSMNRSVAVGHTQLAGFAFVCLAFVALIRFLRHRRLRTAVALGLCAGATWMMTAYYSVLLALVVTAFLLVWLVGRLVRREGLGPRFAAGMVLAAAAAALMVLPTIGPYIQLQQTGLFQRTLAASSTGVDFRTAMAPPPSVIYGSFARAHIPAPYDRGGEFPGGVLLALILCGAGAGLWDWQNRRTGAPAALAAPVGRPATKDGRANGNGAAPRGAAGRNAAPTYDWLGEDLGVPARPGAADGEQRVTGRLPFVRRADAQPDRVRVVGPLAAGAVLCLALVFGPGRGWLSEPYLWLRSTIPTIVSLRDLDRFWIFPMLCLGLLAGAAVRRLQIGLPRSARAALLVSVVALAWIELLFRPPLASAPHFQQSVAANQMLTKLPAGPVLELPEPVGPVFPYVATVREVNSLIDRNPRVDGYSGDIPPEVLDVEGIASAWGVSDIVGPMQRYGIRYLVLHAAPKACAAGYSAEEMETIQQSLVGVPGVDRMISAGSDVIVQLAPAPIDRTLPHVHSLPRSIDCGFANAIRSGPLSRQ